MSLASFHFCGVFSLSFLLVYSDYDTHPKCLVGSINLTVSLILYIIKISTGFFISMHGLLSDFFPGGLLFHSIVTQAPVILNFLRKQK